MDMLTSLLTQPLQILRQCYLHVQSYNPDLKPLPTENWGEKGEGWFGVFFVCGFSR